MPDDTAALIGGVVGGIVAFLLGCGLIAFLVARSRRRGKGAASNDTVLQSAGARLSNNDARESIVAPNIGSYDSFLPSSTEITYGEVPGANNIDVITSPSPETYGVLPTKKKEQYQVGTYTKPNHTGTGYGDLDLRS